MLTLALRTQPAPTVAVAQQSVPSAVTSVYVDRPFVAPIDEPEPEALTEAEMAPFKALEVLERKVNRVSRCP